LKILLADTFVEARRRLSAGDQARVWDFLEKLQTDPTLKGLNVEKIRNARGDDMRSARVTDEIRAVLWMDGDIIVAVHVDRHDAAYDWALKHRCGRDALTDAIQLIEIPAAPADESVAPTAGGQPSAPPVFDRSRFSDDYLLSLGVPGEWLPTIRRVTSPDDLLDFCGRLPDEIVERLLDAADGRPVPRAERAEDPVKAPDTLRRFVVLERDMDLEAALDAPLRKWTVFLHPSQRAVAYGAFSGPVKVTGSAGTGKTVVALHRARHLAKQGKRVLLATYVNTLAKVLESSLEAFGDKSFEPGRIDVRTVLAVARSIADRADGPVGLMEDKDIRDAIREAARAVASPRPEAFLWAEWEAVVAAQGIRTREEYLSADRAGRGTALRRSERLEVWRVFDRVLARMKERRQEYGAHICRRAAEALREGRVASPYDAVLVDEVQDLQPQQLAFVAALAGTGPDALTVVGDAGQRIYARGFSLRSLGVETRGRSHVLRINYRTTEQIRRSADRVLGAAVDDLDDGAEDRRGTRSVMRGPEPQWHGFRTPEGQYDYIIGMIRAEAKSGILPNEMAVFARSNRLLEALEARFRAEGLPFRRLGREGMESSDEEVNTGTLHRSKGLEFRVVFVADASDAQIPNRAALETGDPADEKAALERERNVLYVAMTRARDELYVTWSGKPSRFLEPLLASGNRSRSPAS
jgi:superfamily I DNA/RNA helicase